jgi:hypothetical protein
MVAGGTEAAGVGGELGGVVVCPETKEANRRNAAVRRINRESPRGSKNFRIQDEDGESSVVLRFDMCGLKLENQ